MKFTFRQGQLDWITEIPKDSQGNHKANFRLWSNNHVRKAQTFLSPVIYSLHWMWKQQWYASLLYATEKSGFLEMQRDLDTLTTAGVEGRTPDLLIHLRRMYLVLEVNYKEFMKKKFKGLKRGGVSNLLEAMQMYQRVLTEVNNAHSFPNEEQYTSTFQQIATSEEWDKIYHRVAEKMLDADEGADLNKMKFTDI
uniref:Uncharacterized protein n=1 Tax=Chromera velia CCMP2878 TaxID=1169474 RepID=A0A0G4FNV0_9ALVE|eukprot:Cvel_17990.t1-p1 / transcript=Cvel_17990.t1 / gene=Cvel_17990 / organism=Chromera_velia_CCMP2878 / gene_product=hypothetical protein / transcript_product=hypothetical protein / location=Cvel_scaffold1466:19088-19669(+) / protein_length=194 / sequence_SO=supercontig / SO=protein_coding / is_pseudo=false